jgi:predicted amidohydrolase
VVGVNRVGSDGAGFAYSGDSGVIDPLGGVLWQQSDIQAVKTVILSGEVLDETRAQLPFLRDGDGFIVPE